MGGAGAPPKEGRRPGSLIAAVALAAFPALVSTTDEGLESAVQSTSGTRRAMTPRDTFGPREPVTVLCEPSAWPLPVDGALCDAARRIAVWLTEDGSGEPEEGEHPSIASWLVGRALHEAGVVDPHVRARRIQAETYNEIFLELEAAIADWSAEASCIGMALSPAPAGRPTAVILGARRLVHVEPFPAVLEVEEGLRLQGRLAAFASSPSAYIGLDEGPVQSVEIDVSADAFLLDTGPLPKGRHTIEILVEAGEGPEVALLAPIQVGGAPGPVSRPSPIADGSPVAALHQAVADHRARRGLSRAMRDPTLDELAAERADAIAARGRPVHRHGPNEDAAARLAARGYPFAWAAENLSTGPGPAEAFHGLIESPAHRHLLEHDRARRIGVGVSAGEDRVWVAVLLAEPMDSRSSLPFQTAELATETRLIHRAEDALGAQRRRSGLSAPARDPALDELAGALARHLAEHDLPSDAEAQARARRMAFEADDQASAVTVEVVIGGRPEDIVRAPSAVEDDCDRIGLGIAAARSARFGGERFWMTALCVHRKAPR